MPDFNVVELVPDLGQEGMRPYLGVVLTRQGRPALDTASVG